MLIPTVDPDHGLDSRPLLFHIHKSTSNPPYNGISYLQDADSNTVLDCRVFVKKQSLPKLEEY